MKNKIAIFYGGKLGRRIEMLVEAGVKLGTRVDAISYKEVYLDSEERKDGKIIVGLRSGKDLNEYGVIYFKMVKNYKEEVGLIVDSADDEVSIFDSLLKRGRSTDYCKVHQMKTMIDNGLKVPRFIMGNLEYLRYEAVKKFSYPMILKGSKGDRRTQVFKFFSDDSWEKGWETFLMREKDENQRYMLQEYVENKEDYRVMVVGEKVLGVMKRAIGVNERLKNVFTLSELPKEVLEKAIKAAKICEVEIAGVDVVFKKEEKEPYFWEVNRAPNYDRFMEVTGIDVPGEIIKYFISFLKI